MSDLQGTMSNFQGTMDKISTMFDKFVTNKDPKTNFDHRQVETSFSSSDHHPSFFLNSQCHSSRDMHHGHRGPKLDMHKFDGIDLVGGVAQMEYFFFLHKIFQDVDKLQVGIPYLDVERW